MKVYRATGISIALTILISLCMSCNSQTNFASPPNYDLDHPFIVYLKSELSEISGISYYPKDTSLFAISDATGSLYKIYPTRNALVQQWKFGKNHDYEDLVRVDSTFYVLSSSGDIVSVKFNLNGSMKTSEFKIHDKDKNEFETLYLDTSLNKLILVCKNCKQDKKSTVSTVSFDIANNKFEDGPYKINVKKIADKMNVKKINFKPSAAAINPLTHELFILASVNNALVIADKNGNAKAVYALRPSIYKQPEGIAFTPEGDLLISNESAKEGDADILLIKYKK